MVVEFEKNMEKLIEGFIQFKLLFFEFYAKNR